MPRPVSNSEPINFPKPSEKQKVIGSLLFALGIISYIGVFVIGFLMSKANPLISRDVGLPILMGAVIVGTLANMIGVGLVSNHCSEQKAYANAQKHARLTKQEKQYLEEEKKRPPGRRYQDDGRTYAHLPPPVTPGFDASVYGGVK